MWGAIYDDSGGGRGALHHDIFNLHWQPPGKPWSETVNRLWTLRSQHWHYVSSHGSQRPDQSRPVQPVSHHQEQADCSYRKHKLPQYPQLQRGHPYPGPRVLTRHASSSKSRPNDPYAPLLHKQSPLQPCDSRRDWTHRRVLPSRVDDRSRHVHAYQQGHRQQDSFPVKSKSASGLLIDKEKEKFRSAFPRRLSKASVLQRIASPPKSTQTSTPINQQNHGSRGAHHQKGIKRSSFRWSEEVIAVPSSLVKETDVKALLHIVDKNVESYFHELKQPSSAMYKDFKPLKPSPIIQGGRLYHFKPPNLDARREVLKAIQDYHINAEARAQLEKRANEFEVVKRERQRKNAASRREAAMESSSRRPSTVHT
ncbi:hypothetical protein KP509_05G067600 [Ceratopteris richardii]|uniref:Uncharacterized protein n=1 Tax=Ceratopteris richardii TaxID=49495 RepID=A0A8T2UMI5_CERRI|nr:hypothetical protein KP509_05G067600 [Ceratopteris richardii]